MEKSKPIEVRFNIDSEEDPNFFEDFNKVKKKTGIHTNKDLVRYLVKKGIEQELRPSTQN
jgi:hypothetical protein